MLLKRLRTKRCQKSRTTSRSRCRQGKEIDKGVPLSNYGKNVGRLDWAGVGNGYEEVNGGISMATRELRTKKMDGREQRPSLPRRRFWGREEIRAPLKTPAWEANRDPAAF